MLCVVLNFNIILYGKIHVPFFIINKFKKTNSHCAIQSAFI